MASIGWDIFKGRNITLLPNNGFLKSYHYGMAWNHGNDSNKHNGNDDPLDPQDVNRNYIKMM